MTPLITVRHQGRIGRLCNRRNGQMTIIGSFKLTADGSYNGEISTLTINRKARLVPTDAPGKNAPDLRVFIGLAEIGVAWQKTSRGGDRYFAVKLDDPSFAAPIWANLVESRQDVAVFNLLWDRPTRSAERAAA
jgi:uncharacterized protein (DUF736 family)